MLPKKGRYFQLAGQCNSNSQVSKTTKLHRCPRYCPLNKLAIRPHALLASQTLLPKFICIFGVFFYRSVKYGYFKRLLLFLLVLLFIIFLSISESNPLSYAIQPH